MSKAAVYAGLGQGLMSLGQGVGKAFEVTAIEKLREENMRQNWARQDAIRAEDQAIRAEQYNDTKLYRQEQAELQQTNRAEDQANRAATLELQKDKLDQSIKIQTQAQEKQAIANQDRIFRSVTAQESKRIESLQSEMDKIENEIRRESADGGFTEPLVKQYEATKTAYDKANEAYQNKVLATFEGDESLSPQSQAYDALRRIKFEKTQKPEVVETSQPGPSLPSVDDVLNNGKKAQAGNEQSKPKKYGMTFGDATGVAPLGNAIGGLMSDISIGIDENLLVAKYAKYGARNMSKEELSRAYQRAKETNNNKIAERIMNELKKS